MATSSLCLSYTGKDGILACTTESASLVQCLLRIVPLYRCNVSCGSCKTFRVLLLLVLEMSLYKSDFTIIIVVIMSVRLLLLLLLVCVSSSSFHHHDNHRFLIIIIITKNICLQGRYAETGHTKREGSHTSLNIN